MSLNPKSLESTGDGQDSASEAHPPPSTQTKLCNIYYKVDIEYILNMFVCLHKNIVHFAKLRILQDREYDNEHDVSIYLHVQTMS